LLWGKEVERVEKVSSDKYFFQTLRWEEKELTVEEELDLDCLLVLMKKVVNHFLKLVD